ncbi:MAG: Do family serine endopeptidase [Vibrionaceae bacterium]
MKKRSLTAFTALAIAVSSVLSFPVTASLPTIVAGQPMPSLAPMLEKVSPAVVSISVQGSHELRQRIPEPFRFFFGQDAPLEQVQERPFQGLGSGVIIDKNKGYIITNNHVIDNADKIRIQLFDGREYDAKLIGSDSLSDVALLKIEKAENLTEIKLSDSDLLRVGDFAVAIGNPFGLGQTATSGIISALGRSGLNIENFENFIQTDAAINSGNSGGALINLKGELIGMNTAILGPNGGNVGIGFAIPSNMIKSISDQILEFGEVKRGVLGVIGGELNTELAKTFGYKTNHGAFVSQVTKDSAAEAAGIQAGDIITAVNGKSIRSFSELRAKIAVIGAGKTVKLGLIRNGKSLDVMVTLKEMAQTITNAQNLHKAFTGAALENHNKDGLQGVRISQVQKGSLAARYGLKENDIIMELNRVPIKNIDELRKQINATKNSILALQVVRGNTNLYLVIR